MENYRKSIGAIIILLLSIIFVQNANAIVLTTEITPTSVNWDNPVVQCIPTYQGTWIDSTNWQCPRTSYSNSWDGDTYAIRTKNTYPVQEGYYYQIQIVLRNPNLLPDLQLSPIFWNFNQNEDFTPITLEVWYEDNKANQTTCQYSYNNSSISSSNCLEHKVAYNAIYTFTMQAKSTKNAYFQVGANTGVLVSANRTGITGYNNYNYTFGMKKIVEFKSGNSTAEAEEKTEEASNEGETNSQQADADNEQASQNVIGVISNILGAFGTPAGDCTLPGNLGNLNMGNINLCQGKPPEIANIINIVGSIIIVYACYRVARNIFRIWLAITTFAQGNSKGGN